MAWLKWLDPAYLILRWILGGFLSAKLEKEELEFVESNIKKHRKALWVNAVLSAVMVVAIRTVPEDKLGSLIAGLIAPVMVMGGAWFAISFGAIPSKLMHVSMSITLAMFIAFTVSLSAMFISVAYVAPWPIWIVLAVIYAAAFTSCVLYDTSDGLKAGLDDALLQSSRASLLYYNREEREGIRVQDANSEK